jgi:thimet oligopeptidase
MALHGRCFKSTAIRNLEKMENATALGYVPTTEFPGQFNHIMGGYQVGYYGYMWSEVMALDMFLLW